MTPSTNETGPEGSEQREDVHIEYLQWLAESDLSEVLTLSRETAGRVLTEKRIEIVAAIADGDVESVRDLARRLDRDVSIVSRDLDVLFEAAVIDYERDGRAKRPVLAHENVFVEPVVFEGKVLAE
jgi:predicted transcriptional regulator